jgi:hypothetical protein
MKVRDLAFLPAASILGIATAAGAAEHARAQSAIIAGEPSLSDDDDVLHLFVRDGADVQRCSAVLVGPDRALTARHCVSRVEPGIFRCDERGELSLSFGNAGAFSADRAPGSLSFTYGTTTPAVADRPDAIGRAIEHDRAPFVCDHDLAIVLLDRPIPRRPRSIANRRPRVGDRVRVIAWGQDANGAVDTRLTRTVGLTRIGPSPGAADREALGPNEIAAGEVACSGDSGGAVVDEAGALVAIVVRGHGSRLAARGPDCFGERAESVFRLVVRQEAEATTAEGRDEGTSCAVSRRQDRSTAVLVSIILVTAIGRQWRRSGSRSDRRRNRPRELSANSRERARCDSRT